MLETCKILFLFGKKKCQKGNSTFEQVGNQRKYRTVEQKVRNMLKEVHELSELEISSREIEEEIRRKIDRVSSSHLGFSD